MTVRKKSLINGGEQALPNKGKKTKIESNRLDSSLSEGANGAKPVEPGAKKERKVLKAFNGLSPREWTLLSRNVWSDLSSPRHKRHLQHGAVFPAKLADRLIQMYSGEGDLVLDPFAGIGTTLVAAKRLKRNSVGFELNPDFAKLAQEWFDEDSADLFSDNLNQQELIIGDCRSVDSVLMENSVQVTITSPPYANFIQRSIADRAKTHKKSRIVLHNNSRVRQYSENEYDFGNLEYEEFLEESKSLFAKILKITKPNGYAIWVVKDYRLPPKRPYISMHSDLAQVAQATGWLWHDLIVWDQNEQRSLVLLGYPTRFYTNQNCSFLVVLRKDV